MSLHRRYMCPRLFIDKDITLLREEAFIFKVGISASELDFKADSP
jgi:hypothetical protein